MNIEVRSARADEMAEFSRVPRYVFASNGEPSEEPELLQPEWTTAAFIDGRIAGTMGAYPFRMRLNGVAVPAAGITAVGTYPEYRRRGVLRAIKQHGLREQRERGQAIAILWASFGAIYQRFGYGLAATHQAYEVDPREAALFDGPAPSGSVRLTDAEEARPVLERLYVEYSRPRNLMLHRAPQMWDARLRTSGGMRTHLGIYRDGAGEPRGYLVYGTKEDDQPFVSGPNQRMEVRDWVALDMDAWRGIWAHIRAHDLVKSARIVTPEDDPAPLLLLEPRALHRRQGDGIWMRVVDVERALPQRPYGDRGSLVLRVTDDLCDWNDGCFRLETDGHATEVTRTNDDPDLVMPVRSLAMLLSGHASATALVRSSQLDAPDDAARTLADRLFATAYRPYCPDGF